MTGRLGVVRATFLAFCGSDINYFPRRSGADKPETIDVDALVQEIVEALDKEVAADRAKELIEYAKASFTEVKQATEYQDQKTARLLTVMAFLTAAAASLFSKFVDSYPLHGWTATPVTTIVSHVLFGAFVMLVSLGALVSFHAMQTRFLAPEDGEVVGNSLKSSLFFRFIVLAEPKTWAGSFNQQTVDVFRRYLRNYVTEAYLVAAKTADKVRFLGPAQALLSWAIRVLILWFVSVAVAVTFSAPVAKTQESVGQPTTNNSPTPKPLAPAASAPTPSSPSADLPPTSAATTGSAASSRETAPTKKAKESAEQSPARPTPGTK